MEPLRRLLECNSCCFVYIAPEMSKLAVSICLNVLSYVMCLPIILIFFILLFIFEDHVSARCVVDVLALFIFPVAPGRTLLVH